MGRTAFILYGYYIIRISFFSIQSEKCSELFTKSHSLHEYTMSAGYSYIFNDGEDCTNEYEGDTRTGVKGISVFRVCDS